MDFGRSISYVRQDPNWLVKVILGSIIMFIPIVNFAALGFIANTMRNINAGQETPLPDWGNDFGGLFVRGFKYIVVTLIYTLPIIVVSGVFGGIVAGVTSAASNSDAAGNTIGLLFLCLVPIVFIGALVLGLLGIIAAVRFAITDDFGSAMRFGEVFAELRNNIGVWLIMILFTVLASVIFQFIGMITCGLGFLVIFYLYLIQAHLAVQAHRQSTGSMVTEPARY